MDRQPFSINMWQEDRRIMVASPLPGMEPGNIHVQIDGRKLTIAGDLRGPGQDRTQGYLLREWTAGPYERSVDLPETVDAGRANATYDNGVLVIILPIADKPVSGRLTIPKVGTAKGMLIRHVGHDLQPR